MNYYDLLDITQESTLNNINDAFYVKAIQYINEPNKLFEICRAYLTLSENKTSYDLFDEKINKNKVNVKQLLKNILIPDNFKWYRYGLEYKLLSGDNINACIHTISKKELKKTKSPIKGKYKHKLPNILINRSKLHVIKDKLFIDDAFLLNYDFHNMNISDSDIEEDINNIVENISELNMSSDEDDDIIISDSDDTDDSDDEIIINSVYN